MQITEDFIGNMVDVGGCNFGCKCLNQLLGWGDLSTTVHHDPWDCSLWSWRLICYWVGLSLWFDDDGLLGASHCGLMVWY